MKFRENNQPKTGESHKKKGNRLTTQPRIVKDVQFEHSHLDEATAYFLALRFGSHVFIGITSAHIDFLPHIKKQTPEQWQKGTTLAIGSGGDIDEHRDGKTARVKGSSSTKMIWDMIASSDPHLLKMMEEINYYDSEKGCPKHHLANLVKMAKVQMPKSDDKILLWVIKVLELVYARHHYALGKQEKEPEFMKFVHQTVSKGKKFSDEETRTKMLEEIKVGSGPSGKQTLFGLKELYEAFWRASPHADLKKRKREVQENLSFALNLLYQDQLSFVTYYREMERVLKGRNTIKFNISVEDGEQRHLIRAAKVRTNNPKAHAVLRSLGAVLTIVKNTQGNISIQCNSHYAREEWLRQALDRGIVEFCAMNRFTEMSGVLRATASWSLLQGRGNCPGDARWYLTDPGWLAILNGSHYHGVAPTSITLGEAQNNAQAAFSPVYVKMWKEQMQVPEDRLPHLLKEHSSSTQGDGLHDLAAAMDKK